MKSEIQHYMLSLGESARAASRVLACADTATKNKALLAIADHINKSRAELTEANQKDLANGKANGLDAALLDRLELNEARIDGMIEGIEQVAGLPDPCGEITDMAYRPSGIQVGKMRVALGVIGIIYESRPNVTVDAAALCLKSGNATILRGGSEASLSNQAIAKCIVKGLEQTGLPGAAVQVVETTDRDAVGALIRMNEFVDVIVPRGGKGLIERISSEATVPVIKHLDGVCHVYVDRSAELGKAFDVALNSKTHRYGVCNAMETLLVHQDVAEEFLPKIAQAYKDKGVELRVCRATKNILPDAVDATEEDWSTEYLAPVLSIKIVQHSEQAMTHINTYGSHHTDTIITEDYSLSRLFLRSVDSSTVMVNASTRFADGFEFGLGAEIGISTDKIHTRGPVGLEGLTSQKWIALGDGHIRA